MTRTPGDTPDHSGDEVLQVDEVTLVELGEKLAELSKQLQQVSELAINKQRTEYLRGLSAVGGDLDDVERAKLDAEADDDFRRILVGLRTFRRDYEYWQRVIAEFALTRRKLTQRDAARLLGVGVSTINRWAQHPLKVQDYR